MRNIFIQHFLLETHYGGHRPVTCLVKNPELRRAAMCELAYLNEGLFERSGVPDTFRKSDQSGPQFPFHLSPCLLTDKERWCNYRLI